METVGPAPGAISRRCLGLLRTVSRTPGHLRKRPRADQGRGVALGAKSRRPG